MRNEPRWKAVITYRTDRGPVSITYNVEEISELHDIVEGGPDWNVIEDIAVTLRRVTKPGLTIANAWGDEE